VVIRARVKGLEVSQTLAQNRIESCKFAEEGRALRFFLGVDGVVRGQQRPAGRCDALLHQLWQEPAAKFDE